MVLLKGFGQDGFRFFTNRQSRKGRELVSAGHRGRGGGCGPGPPRVSPPLWRRSRGPPAR